MANLSQQRRQRMLDFLQKVRDKNKDDDEALVAIGEIENELTEKKYGLIWEEHSEDVEDQMLDNVPVFVENKDKEITMTENGYNFLLEGDNLHSLHLLEKTHKEKIDVIYIDPPYNTGKEDFCYDDYRVGSDDGYRHSKWLSFMYSRLSIAKKLLTKRGAIFISIDNNEQAALKLLCDCVFGAQNYVGMFSVENNPKGKKNGKHISVTNEYCLIYVKDFESSEFRKTIPKEASDMAADENGDFVRKSGKRVLMGENKFNKPVTDFSSKKHYVAYIKDSELILKKETNLEDADQELLDKGFRRYVTFSGDSFVENTYSEDKFSELFDTGALDIRADKIYEKRFSDNKQIKSMLTNASYEAISDNKKVLYEMDLKTTSARRQLIDVLGYEAFSYPKNVNFIKHLIELNSNTDSIILDFFAGSGTTGQAVLELNKEDGGNRKFILCTNNENNICEGVTYPRLQTVITGMRKDGNKYSDGIAADLKYYHTDFVSKSSTSLAEDLLEHIDEMIQLEFGVKIDKEKYVSILSDEDADELEKNWSNYQNIRAIYVSRKVLLTATQRDLFKTKDCFIIPDYYFRDELKEAGEI